MHNDYSSNAKVKIQFVFSEKICELFFYFKIILKKDKEIFSFFFFASPKNNDGLLDDFS